MGAVIDNNQNLVPVTVGNFATSFSGRACSYALS
jgi:hypothetical protein